MVPDEKNTGYLTTGHTDQIPDMTLVSFNTFKHLNCTQKDRTLISSNLLNYCVQHLSVKTNIDAISHYHLDDTSFDFDSILHKL